MRWNGLLLLAMFVGACCVCGPALADKRVALLIGNAHYESAGVLNNPLNDVAGMAEALRDAGFATVQADTDLDREGMVKALRSFEDEAADADVAVIYYSGHGMEMDGTNYLIPVDARLASDRDVEDEAITLDRVLRAVDEAKRLKLVILDACRDNPFLSKMARAASTRSVVKGLARVEPATVNTLIAFSARAGTVAQDGDGAHSPFTASLIRHIVEPGVDVRIVLGEVRDDVMASSGGTQEPFVNGSLGGGTIAVVDLASDPAHGAGGAMADLIKRAQAGVDPRVAEAALVWPSLANSNDIPSLAAFKTRYAGTIFADMAASRIALLTVSAPPPRDAAPRPATQAPALPVPPLADAVRLRVGIGDSGSDGKPVEGAGSCSVTLESFHPGAAGGGRIYPTNCEGSLGTVVAWSSKEGTIFFDDRQGDHVAEFAPVVDNGRIGRYNLVGYWQGKVISTWRPCVGNETQSCDQ